MHSGNDPSNGPYTRSEAQWQSDAGVSFWNAVRSLYGRRKILVAVPFCIAVITAVMTLLIPNYFKATATVLVPESSGSPLSAAIFRNLTSAAFALGRGSGGYTRYMAILKSRTVLATAVDSFNLARVYELEDEEHPRESAILTLRDHFEAELDSEFDYLEISFTDHDPERAAAIANFLVRRLNDTNARLASQNAANYRRSIEQRYDRARAEMDSVLDATVRFQQKHGVYDLPAQAEGFFEQVAQLRARALEAEIGYESLLPQYGPDNPQVTAYRELAEAANQKYLGALQGKERLLPLAQSEVPSVGRRYVDLEMNRAIQRTILEALAPMYEHARLQEEQEATAVQVLDFAVPPTRKAGPKRTATVIAAAISALILTMLYVLALSWWKGHASQISQHLEAGHTSKPSDASKSEKLPQI